jgi:F-type H+-transporting ATPase subunit gamma
MFSHAIGIVHCTSAATAGQVRGMATLKDIAVRLKSVKNIQKITKSMKMVSAAKYNKAERELRAARPYGHGAKEFYDKAEISKGLEAPKNHVIIAVTSDRGLCGAANSSIVKVVRLWMNENKEAARDTRIVAIGDKARGMLARQFSQNMLFHVTDIGKKPPTFEDASDISLALLNNDVDFDKASMYFNTFKSVVSYRTTLQPLYSLAAVSNADKLTLYDSVDADLLQSYNEFTMTSLIYYALKEAAASEQSSRMTAMDSASKNAGEMIDKLTLLYNRTRQAAITRELTEIISGAAAV